MTTKEQLHSLVDMLPEAEIPAAGRFLQFLVTEAPDDSLTEEDWKAIRIGQSEIASGEYTTLEDLKRDLNL